jgi:hypothetical protein
MSLLSHNIALLISELNSFSLYLYLSVLKVRANINLGQFHRQNVTRDTQKYGMYGFSHSLANVRCSLSINF